ncbi:MAG: polysaccharide biosynthesis protein, partial [Pseudomonadota bacterium]
AGTDDYTPSIPIVADFDHFEQWIESQAKTKHFNNVKLIFSEFNVNGEALQKLSTLAEKHQMTLARLPKLSELAKIGFTSLESIDINELLGRKINQLDLIESKSMVEHKNVLITGAGGSIGQELIKQISLLSPKHIALLDHNELALYNAKMLLQEQMAKNNQKTPHSIWLVDVCNTERVKQVFEQEKPDLIWHAAALKHVPIAEAFPIQAIETNLIGTHNIAENCRTYKCQTMVLISTDKAVNPTSIMGATKRLAESWMQALDVATPESCFVSVRFGNVLGSTGSVVPLFKRQIELGGPVTVTDNQMTRYFMSLSEAIQLVLKAAMIANIANQKNPHLAGSLYILEMGQPIKIDALARKMIRLSGLQPDQDIKIEYTGLRAGEKLHEQLLHENEIDGHSASPGIIRAKPRTSDIQNLSKIIDQFASACQKNDTDTAYKLLIKHVPEYQKHSA